MEVRYGDDRVRRVVSDADVSWCAWDRAVIRACRLRDQALQAATGQADLRALRFLDFRAEPVRGDLTASIEVAGGFRLMLEFDARNPAVVTVAAMVESAQEVAP